MTISRTTKAARWAGVLLVALAPLPWLGMSTATASPGNEDNVTICHRTNAVTNPYRVITVDPSAIDGKGGADHFGKHLGPVFDPEEEYPPPHNGDQWGDIIPPLVGVHDGLNWNEAGIAIYENDCQVPGVSPSPSDSESTDTASPSDTESTDTASPSDTESTDTASPSDTESTDTAGPSESSSSGGALPTETEKGGKPRNSESAAAAAAALPKTGSGLPVAGALGASLLLIGLGMLLLLGPGRLVPVYHRKH